MKMWSRVQLHIGWRDLAAGLGACIVPGDRRAHTKLAEEYWPDGCPTLATLSVRSGFDLLLQALDLEPGDEIIFSAINIRGMAKIARAHNLVTVPLDLDVNGLAPCADQLESVITPRSRVLVVAHLFGALINLDALCEVARRHGIVIVEDCAQAFDGRAYPGHPAADVSMFSFGPLKTATALGGGLIRVRDHTLAEKMRGIEASYPTQSNLLQLKQLATFCILKFVSQPRIFGLIHRLLHLFGADYDDALGEQLRSVARQVSAKKYRYRPATSMLKLLVRRLYTFREGELGARARRGTLLLSLLEDKVVVPGTNSPHHHYWVFPVIANNPQQFISELKKSGFDSSGWTRSRIVAPPQDRLDLHPEKASKILHDLVFVPCYPAMSDDEIARQAQKINEITARTAN